MTAEVRYHMLRPAQVVERRRAFPVAYVPLGTLEWHGVHNPLGADTLQAEGLAVRAAELGGGLAFPPLYYGESRLESLMEANAHDRREIAEAMALPAENFTPERHPFSPAEQYNNYHKLLLHVLAEVESLGFEVGVLVAGHYPLVDHARAAVLIHNKHHRGGRKMLAWACVDYLLIRDRYADGGDHAAGWETSHLMHLHGQTVDLSLLPPEGEPIVGVAGAMPPQRATAEYGKQTLEAAAEALVHEARHRLEHRDQYMAHGMYLQEGLWRKG